MKTNELTTVKEYTPNEGVISGLELLDNMKTAINNSSVVAVQSIIKDIIVNYPTYKNFLNDAKLFKKEIYSMMIKKYKTKFAGRKYALQLVNLAGKILSINNIKINFKLVTLANLKLIGSHKNLPKSEINKLFIITDKKEYNKQLKAILKPLQLELLDTNISDVKTLIKEKHNSKTDILELQKYINELAKGLN